MKKEDKIAIVVLSAIGIIIISIAIVAYDHQVKTDKEVNQLIAESEQEIQKADKVLQEGKKVINDTEKKLDLIVKSFD